MERVKGIEPSSQAWEARILPLNHTRLLSKIITFASLAASLNSTSLNSTNRLAPIGAHLDAKLRTSAAAPFFRAAFPTLSRGELARAIVRARSFGAWFVGRAGRAPRAICRRRERRSLRR